MSVFGFRIEYELGGVPDHRALQKLTVAFDRTGANFARFGEYVFPRIAAALEREIGGQFDARGRGQAGPWAKLSRRYAAWKARNYPGKGILERTGALRAGLTQSGSAYAERVYTSTQMSFGTRGLNYASFHQTGTRKMPARPPLDLTDAFERIAQEEGQLAAVDLIRAEQAVLDVTK